MPEGMRARSRAWLQARLQTWPLLRSRPPLRGGTGHPAGGTAILPGLDTKPAPMRPLRPPAAENDNPMRSLHEAVERELRAHGHLR